MNMLDDRPSSRKPHFSRAFRWLACVVVAALSVLVLYEMAQYTTGTQSDWPLEIRTGDHPLGNTFGELYEYRTRQPPAQLSSLYYKQHPGLDILAKPCCEDSAPYVVVTATGKATTWDIDPGYNYNSIEISATVQGKQHVYTYTHLEHPPLADPYQSYNAGVAILDGTRITKVREAFPCGYSHLHYGITVDSDAVNPLREIGPEPDGQKPFIAGVHLVKRGSSPPSVFDGVNSCPPVSNTVDMAGVSGTVDIVVEVSDMDDAGSPASAAGNLGIYDLKWRACATSDPDCDWNDTHTYDDMPAYWSAYNDATIGQRFSLVEPFRTIREEWSDLPDTWIGPPVSCEALPVPRTFMFAAKDGAGWNTKKYNNGSYELSVKALDYRQNEAIHKQTVCVKNP